MQSNRTTEYGLKLCDYRRYRWSTCIGIGGIYSTV